MLDLDGNIVATYVYDAWGNHRVYNAAGEDITDDPDNAGHIAFGNPFRYRGYYFDDEMKLYYLQSRFYDPKVKRFISPDDISYIDPETINGLNLYAYCRNNPVMYSDPNGNFPILAAALTAVALIGLGLTIGGVATDNNVLTAVGLGMVAIPAVVSGVGALILATPVSIVTGGITAVAGIGSAAFMSAEIQEATGNGNWIMSSGISESTYNALLLSVAAIATAGTIASQLVSNLQIGQILKVGRIKGVRASKGHFGIRYRTKYGKIYSFELHSPHQTHGWHLQKNTWWLNHKQYNGQYYRAFGRHLDIFKFWKGWF